MRQWRIGGVLSVLVTMVLLIPATTTGQQVVARVSVSSHEHVVALHARGLHIDDARVHEKVTTEGEVKHQVIYNPENGFVTVIAEHAQVERLHADGFQVSRQEPYTFHPDTPTRTSLDTIPYQFGWPRQIVNGITLYENSPTVADIDRNGQLEVSVTNAWGAYSPPAPPYMIVWRRTGAYLPGFPVALQPGVLQSSAEHGISAIGDIFGDDRLEIVCGDENGYLYAFNHDGTLLNGFPLHYGLFTGVFTPALADFDGDGKLDIAVIRHNWDSPYDNAFLHLYKVTATGPVDLPGFPINLQIGARNSPAVGDIDGDGDLDIVVATGGTTANPIARIIAYNHLGQVKPGFPFLVGSASAGNSPTLYDITGDGKLEILIRVRPDSTLVNGIYAIDYQGQIVNGFPFPITFGNPGSCVAVGDMDGDGIPELAYGGVEAVDSGKVWVYNLKGDLLPGFPARVFRTWVDGSVAIADVDGDGYGDVVYGTNGVSNKPGLIGAFNRFGQVVAGFPLSPGNPIINSFTTHPTLVDIDGDGDTEIFAGRTDKFVYGWDTPGVFDSTRAWRMFKGNAARTGGQLQSPVVSVRQPDPLPAAAVLKQNYPNPFNPSTTIEYVIPSRGRVELTVFNTLGEMVAMLINREQESGTHRVEWKADGVASGVYLLRLSHGSFVQTSKLMLIR
jgi:hypothetical protein